MKILHIVRWSAVAALMAASCAMANADKLKIVEVAAPAINCVFVPLCSVIPTDSTAAIPLAFTAGDPFLQSRTFFGVAGTPGSGHTAYEYRVDLRSAAGSHFCATAGSGLRSSVYSNRYASRVNSRLKCGTVCTYGSKVVGLLVTSKLSLVAVVPGVPEPDSPAARFQPRAVLSSASPV